MPVRDACVLAPEFAERSPASAVVDETRHGDVLVEPKPILPLQSLAQRAFHQDALAIAQTGHEVHYHLSTHDLDSPSKRERLRGGEAGPGNYV
jgi:hypothetical protein